LAESVKLAIIPADKTQTFRVDILAPAATAHWSTASASSLAAVVLYFPATMTEAFSINFFRLAAALTHSAAERMTLAGVVVADVAISHRGQSKNE
jgi:hypothetical protein